MLTWLRRLSRTRTSLVLGVVFCRRCSFDMIVVFCYLAAALDLARFYSFLCCLGVDCATMLRDLHLLIMHCHGTQPVVAREMAAAERTWLILCHRVPAKMLPLAGWTRL